MASGGFLHFVDKNSFACSSPLSVFSQFSSTALSDGVRFRVMPAARMMYSPDSSAMTPQQQPVSLQMNGIGVNFTMKKI